MKRNIYKFLILLLIYTCGVLVAKFGHSFMENFLIVLPFSFVVTILFNLYDGEIKK
jgi:uncharacterized membrane protein YoaK (UPF0700 family)